MKNFSLTILIILAGLNCFTAFTAEAPTGSRTPAPATFTCGRAIKVGICVLLAGGLSKLLETGPSVGRLSSIPPKDCCCFSGAIVSTKAIGAIQTVVRGGPTDTGNDYICSHPECTRFCYTVVTSAADF